MYVPKYGTCMCKINISQATRLVFLAWLSRAVLSFLNLAREKVILKSDESNKLARHVCTEQIQFVENN